MGRTVAGMRDLALRIVQSREDVSIFVIEADLAAGVADGMFSMWTELCRVVLALVSDSLG